MGLFSKFNKKNCKEEQLIKVSELYTAVITCIQVQNGDIEEPKEWLEHGVSADTVYLEIVNDINPLIENIFNCKDFPQIESSYWAGHLNAFAANLLYKSRRMNDSIQYYNAAINILTELAEEYPEYAYTDSQVDFDVSKYSADMIMHLSYVRRLYAAMLTQIGQEKLTEEVIKENLEYGEKRFIEDPDTVISYSEDLEQAGDFYRIQDNNQSQHFYKKAVEIVESRADLKIHMDNEDPRLFRLKWLYMTQLEHQGNEVEANKVEEELSPYYEDREDDEEMFPLIKTPLDVHMISKGDSQILFKRIVVSHEAYNFISSEPNEDKQLELFNWCCDEFSELIDAGKNVIFKVLEKESESSVESRTLITYWSLHCQAFLGYIYSRAERKLDVAEKLLFNAAKGFIELEKKGETGYPDIVPWSLIADLDGVYFNSTKAYLSYAGNLSQQDKKKEAGDAYIKAIDNARKALELFNPDEEGIEFYLNEIPAGEKPFEHLALALNKAGEYFRFPPNSDNGHEMAIDFFKEAAELLEENIADLATFMRHEDIRLLLYKDNYASLLRRLNRGKEQEEVEKEIEPYKDFISWRFEENFLDN